MRIQYTLVSMLLLLDSVRQMGFDLLGMISVLADSNVARSL